MPFDVFISYSSKDKIAADTVCNRLEAAGIRCWLAPRDIRPGDDWGKSIVRAIDDCRCMVVIFSANANRSAQVQREVDRALTSERPILPFRIDDATPSDGMAYRMATLHWLDALTPPLEAHVDRLQNYLMSILDPASSPMPLVTTSPQISSSRNRRFLLIVSAAALISIPLIWLWNSQRPESSPPQFQLSKAAPKNPVPTTDPFIANIEEHEANRRSAVGQKIPPQSTTPPTAPTPTVTPTEAPKPVFTKSLSQHAKPAVLEAGEFKIGDGLAIIDDLARRNGSQLGTVVEETKGRVGATADRSFSLEFIQGLSMFRRHVVTTSASPAPELAYTELGYFQFSGPESGSRSYVVGRDLGFPKKPSMQPTRTQVVSDIVSKYGRPTISISCEPINANNPRVRVLIYLYQAGRLIETDVPEFVSTIALDETIPKSNAWSSAFNDLLDIRAHNYIWIQFCLWPTRSDYRSGLSIPPFLSSKLDQMYLASTLAGETDDYVGRIHTVIFDNDAYRSLTNVDQKAIDKRHAERQTPKGVKAPL